ncbi:MAG: heat-inducible transcriptional repressor HrcA [Chlamydiota bacterium]
MKFNDLKKHSKSEREQLVLLGLVDLYITSSKPIGSQTLKEHGFGDLSSATIRNYFANLEKKGYLHQQHTSGGRIPTDKAFKAYAEKTLLQTKTTGLSPQEEKFLARLEIGETKEIAGYLQNAAEVLSELSQCAVFLSAPRFDHDFIRDIKLVNIDDQRCLGVIITDFGLVHTHTLFSNTKISSFTLKRIENYFHWRMTKLDHPTDLSDEELSLAHDFYDELIVRYMVGYSNFSHEDLHQTGFSRLLTHPEFSDAFALASGLSLFENDEAMRHLLKESLRTNSKKYWIGEDLQSEVGIGSHCAVISHPYHINRSPTGAIGILGPLRMPYDHYFELLEKIADQISATLTQSLYKFQISFRHPQTGSLYLNKEEHLLLEDQS